MCENLDLSNSWWQILTMLGESLCSQPIANYQTQLLGIAAVASFAWTLIMRVFGGFM